MPTHFDPTPNADQLFQGLRLPQFAQTSTGPIVVAIEGPNGAGKSTLSWALSRKLGVPCCLGTDEAWFAEQFKERMIRDADWHASAMFFLSGCFEQTRLLRARPESAVILDRSLWSTLAVHAAESAERLPALIQMLQPIAQHIQIPNITLVLDTSFETCRSRIANKTGVDRALDELNATAAFHSREHAFYRWLGRQCPNVLFLETNQLSAERVEDGALALLRPRLAGVAKG